MTAPFVDEEEWDEVPSLVDLEIEDTSEDADDVIDTEDDDGELTLDDVAELEEDENAGHKVQTYDPNDDGVDNYFDERYFDE